MTTTATKSRRITERAAATATVRVDREQGMIFGVKLIGNKSANGREYPQSVLERDAKEYEGKKVFLDHPAESFGSERSFRDWCGVVVNVRSKPGGLYADLKLRRSAASFEEIMEAAEHFASSFGLSHVADCRSRRGRDGVEIIEAINEVLSVDIVTEPATTAGIFESTRPSVQLSESAQRAIASARQWNARVRAEEAAERERERRRAHQLAVRRRAYEHELSERLSTLPKGSLAAKSVSRRLSQIREMVCSNTALDVDPLDPSGTRSHSHSHSHSGDPLRQAIRDAIEDALDSASDDQLREVAAILTVDQLSSSESYERRYQAALKRARAKLDARRPYRAN